ncbi:Gfo/Idh/MocA family protein [Ornithinicoccus halotolerans]|uniref:Gfo/Idh/MocA family protein n=1 Tax=Ornithinicoccus halotolerans TaxID=1748220 RepID=UPI0012981946|nr:Gfo/Idh/MocA family oxidoreductase [Ornithinicoccus halotolerans]
MDQAASTPASQTATAAPAAPVEGLRAAVVGYGMAGRQFHVPLLRQAGWQVTAVTTGDPGRREQARSDLGEVAVLPDLDVLLQEVRSGAVTADAVVLASPTGAHREQALAVIESGLALVVDKPLGLTAAEATEIVEAARGQVPLTVFQNRRYDPDMLTLAQLVAGGELGEVVRAEMRWERWRPAPKQRWRETLPAEQGGGVLLDLHAHTVDAVVQLFGPVASVYAELASRTTIAEDEAFLSCRHVSGVISHLGVSSVTALPGPRWRVLGTHGSYLHGGLGEDPGPFAELHDEAGHCGWRYDGDGGRRPVPAAAGDEADFYRGVATALAGGWQGRLDTAQAALPVDPADSVHVLAVIDAARISAAEQRAVQVDTPGLR